MLSNEGMDSQPIALPVAPAAQRRQPLPLLAAIVPVIAGVVLWLITGSLFSLCFAALGPLMLFASLFDGMRSRRRERRAAEADAEEAWSRAEAELERRTVEERERRWHQHPDAAACRLEAPLRGAQAPDATTTIVVGRGESPSGIRTSGGDDARGRDFQARSSVLGDAPVFVPLDGGLCVRGPRPVAAAAIRALVIQLCLRFGPALLAVVGEPELCGLGGLPHATRSRQGAFRLGIAGPGSSRTTADATIWMLPRGADVPEGITTVIDCVEPQNSLLRTRQGTRALAVECLSLSQTEIIAEECAGRVEDVDVLPEAVRLDEIEQPTRSKGLIAAIGRGEQNIIDVDLVEDGPHAIVTGTTGTGKSELLITWVTAMAQKHGPDQVAFILADFKGGTAFEPLRALPQVAAVITDLDEAGARRGVSSLTAELRRREAALAAAGARDITEVDMPRLVIVVDEFAALLQEHADLGAVFIDIAARGRALGMHLILGTQRAAGIIREALAANCPLRISLRVGDPADSRFVLGTDAASELPGGPGSRGLALVRRPQDLEPIALRVALTGAADLRAAGMQWNGATASASPWLPSLPARLLLDELPEADGGLAVLGRADEPERQAQPLEVLRIGVDRGLAVIGGSASGKSALIRTVAAQRPDAVRVPRDLEDAWDLVARLADASPASAPLLLCDDLDRLLAEFPLEYAQQFVARWEQILRAGAGRTVVITASRAAGPVARLIDAIPERALLRMSSRVEHLAAGGEPAGFERDRLPGRARIADRDVQFAWVDEPQEKQPSAAVGVTSNWEPSTHITGLVTGGGIGASVSALAAAHQGHAVIPAGETLQSGEAPQRGGTPQILVGDAEAWQRNHLLWQRVRAEGEVLVRAECPLELRQLAGVRELPPYARGHAGRAWSVTEGRSPRRVVVAALAP